MLHLEAEWTSKQNMLIADTILAEFWHNLWINLQFMADTILAQFMDCDIYSIWQNIMPNVLFKLYLKKAASRHFQPLYWRDPREIQIFCTYFTSES